MAPNAPEEIENPLTDRKRIACDNSRCVSVGSVNLCLILIKSFGWIFTEWR